MSTAIGIDVGGSSLRAALVDESGKIPSDPELATMTKVRAVRLAASVLDDTRCPSAVVGGGPEATSIGSKLAMAWTARFPASLP